MRPGYKTIEFVDLRLRILIGTISRSILRYSLAVTSSDLRCQLDDGHEVRSVGRLGILVQRQDGGHLPRAHSSWPILLRRLGREDRQIASKVNKAPKGSLARLAPLHSDRGFYLLPII